MDARRKPFDDADLLTKFEQDILREPYKGYYAAKRNNFFASIEGFRDLWDCFMLSNTIWMREFEDMRTVRDTGRMFPPTLFMNGHLKMLIAMELGFSSCLTEAHSILRDAIESVAHGHRLFLTPLCKRFGFRKLMVEPPLTISIASFGITKKINYSMVYLSCSDSGSDFLT